MKNSSFIIILAVVFGFMGGLSSQLLFNSTEQNDTDTIISFKEKVDHSDTYLSSDITSDPKNDIQKLKFKVAQLEGQIKRLNSSLSSNEQADPESSEKTASHQTQKLSSRRAIKPNQENLIAAGISEEIADDILRRISQQDFRRLELQNLIRRNPGNNSKQYRDELRELNKSKISLREELGDNDYDQYLYSSGQNNRMKVTFVMSGSPAESSGIEPGDIIMSYDNKAVFGWKDIQQATLSGEIGNYTSIDVLRDNSNISLMISRGTIGVELEAVQLNPDNYN